VRAMEQDSSSSESHFIQLSRWRGGRSRLRGRDSSVFYAKNARNAIPNWH
jgi:hypothetical protein